MAANGSAKDPIKSNQKCPRFQGNPGDQSLRLYSAPDPVANIGAHTHVSAPTHGERLRHGAPSGRLPMGDYVLFGLLAGLSAAVGFVVPPKSSLTAMR
jgi:hypothetical protein